MNLEMKTCQLGSASEECNTWFSNTGGSFAGGGGG